MKKFFLIISMCIFALVSNAQDYERSMWENHMIGVGYSNFSEPVTFTYEDGGDYHFHDNCIDVFGAIYGIYADASIGVDSNDGDLHANTLNVGYMIPLNQPEYGNPVFYLTPMVGYSNLRWTEYYNQLEAEYFNYGAAIGMQVGNFYIQGKATRCQLGIGIGWKY